MEILFKKLQSYNWQLTKNSSGFHLQVWLHGLGKDKAFINLVERSSEVFQNKIKDALNKITET